MGLIEAKLSLQGLSVGDAFGSALLRYGMDTFLYTKQLPPAPWRWSDDTQMAVSIVEILERYGEINQDALAFSFAHRYAKDPHRGYGLGMRKLLPAIEEGADWREESKRLFGEGSWGNGAAMRVAPLGAFFPGDPEKTAKQAALSAEITHAHIEGVAGAVAVAVAASLVAASRELEGKTWLRLVQRWLPETLVKEKLNQAESISPAEVEKAASVLGTGYDISAMDTVPFCLWICAHFGQSFEKALWMTAAGKGDLDTTCAIVGGIVALKSGHVPENWVNCREALPVS